MRRVASLRDARLTRTDHAIFDLGVHALHRHDTPCNRARFLVLEPYVTRMQEPATVGILDAIPGEAEVQALKRLPFRLAKAGYVDAFTVYGTYNNRVSYWSEVADHLPERLRVLFRLFLLGEKVPRSSLLEIVPEPETAALERFSVLKREGEQVHTRSLVLLPVSGYLVMADRPSVDPVVYFGDDSAALAAHLFPYANGDCLDLCTGPGVQALLASGRGRRVVAVEINPVAAAYAHLNVVMNDVEDRVEVRMGDLYQATPHEQFHFISANPPLLPFPEDLPYPFVGHGGADGLNITRSIIAGLPLHLRPDGLCQIIGTCLGDSNGPLCESELDRIARDLDLSITMTIPSGVPLNTESPMFTGLAWSCATAALLDYQVVLGRLKEHLRSRGAETLYLFFLTITRDQAWCGLHVTRHYRAHRGFWFI